MADLKFEIMQQFGTLSTSKSGWNLELNFVQWGDNQPKFDLRTWSPDHKKMGKGITLTHAELVKLDQALETVLAPETAPVAPTELDDSEDEPQAATSEKPAWGKLNDF
ncbi:hypothetical protein JOC36_000423 [Weissella uvarum]|uniref:YdbC family protein n=1 Tax=Weissella uvarum TaxID=1479233 RepID=UPI0019618E5A|nr:PC4/YdbC family ssDNA-binding protein [Weissella uvarum]MBM7616890.1 hypothetical protein [Weissella uvarum]MCM0594658.1 hypothetical protein [Weissella uvarum]